MVVFTVLTRAVLPPPASRTMSRPLSSFLPSIFTSKTRLPVIGVPVQTRALNGVDSLYSIVQMPRGFPVATMAIGVAGAANAGLMAAQILALGDPALAQRIDDWRAALSASIPEEPVDE